VVSDEPESVASATIAELLVGMASGVVDAQRKLAGVQTHDDRGRPGPTYVLPELEFELRVATQLTEGSDGHQELRVRPIRPGEAGERGLGPELVSTLRGRFVALPPSSGLPPLVLTTEVELLELSARRLLVTLRAGGQPAVDVEVRLDLDLARSRQLSGLGGVELASLGATRLRPAQARTDGQGRATSVLELDPGAAPGTHVVVMIDAGGPRESLVVVV
jgi:hypothetical protein